MHIISGLVATRKRRQQQEQQPAASSDEPPPPPVLPPNEGLRTAEVEIIANVIAQMTEIFKDWEVTWKL